MNITASLFDSLALGVVQRFGMQPGGRILLVTSARPGEGKSYVAKRLALRLALQSQAPVLVIDANSSNPSLHDAFGVDNVGGFFSCIAARSLLPDAMSGCATPNLKVVPAGGPRHGSLLYRSSAVQQVFASVRSDFAYTVIDGPCIPESGCLVQQCDASIVVVDASHTRRDIVGGALSSPHIDRKRLMGVVLNRRPEYVPRWLYRSWL